MCHLIVGVPALGDDVLGVDAGVADGDQAPAPHLALPHVQQEAELALLAPAVAAATSGRGENNQLELLFVCPQQCHIGQNHDGRQEQNTSDISRCTLFVGGKIRTIFLQSL